MKIPYAEPGSSRRNKTGGGQRYPEVDKEKCIGCNQCVEHCPDSCIELIEKKAVVDLGYCKGCAICFGICPVKAISMREK